MFCDCKILPAKLLWCGAGNLSTRLKDRIKVECHKNSNCMESVLSQVFLFNYVRCSVSRANNNCQEFPQTIVNSLKQKLISEQLQKQKQKQNNYFKVFVFMSLSQFTSVFSECFHFHVVFRRLIYMRATYICLDIAETVHQTVVHCTINKKITWDFRYKTISFLAKNIS